MLPSLGAISDNKFNAFNKNLEEPAEKLEKIKQEAAEDPDELRRKNEEQQKETEAATREIDEKVKRVEARAIKMRIWLHRRVVDLTSENDLWRKFFVAAYTNAFSSKNEADKVIEAFLSRNGIKPAKQIGDFKEGDILEMLLDEKSVEKIINEH